MEESGRTVASEPLPCLSSRNHSVRTSRAPKGVPYGVPRDPGTLPGPGPPALPGLPAPPAPPSTPGLPGLLGPLLGLHKAATASQKLGMPRTEIKHARPYAD